MYHKAQDCFSATVTGERQEILGTAAMRFIQVITVSGLSYECTHIGLSSAGIMVLLVSRTKIASTSQALRQKLVKKNWGKSLRLSSRKVDEIL